MRRPFDSFVILAAMRTGSNLLEASLNEVAGLTCHGEAFNPHFVGYPNRETLLGFTRAEREADPLGLLAKIGAQEGLNGFRLFPDHDARALAAALRDRRCAKVILTRDTLDSYISLKIARATGQWKLGSDKTRKTAQPRFEMEEFVSHTADLREFYAQIRSALQTSGQTAFLIDYSELGEAVTLTGLCRFLGIDTEAKPSRGLIRQNPGAAEDKVENPDEMRAALARLDRHDLAEQQAPRPGPGVPRYVAAAGVGLLYLPIRSGPVGRIEEWLSALSGPELVTGFTQKSLRSWMKGNPGHRSFTVLRHPVARAHVAFCAQILEGGYPEIRETLRQVHDVAMPPIEEVGQMDVAAHRKAFLAFLRFLRANLEGQTAVRIDPAWALQTSIVQGFSSVVSPDLVAREDRLESDLAYLAGSQAVTAPPLPLEDPATKAALAAIYSDEVEAAVRRAYRRDYLAFGFQDWAPAP